MLKAEEIVARIQSKLPAAAVEWVAAEHGDSFLVVLAAQLAEVVALLKNDADLQFDYLNNLSALDTKEQIEVVYHLYSYVFRHSFEIKVLVSREGGQIPSISALYGTANFQEREVFDLFGVKFTGHPDLRRILLPDDWVGHPLLNDYQEQEDYNGIGTTRPSLL